MPRPAWMTCHLPAPDNSPTPTRTSQPRRAKSPWQQRLLQALVLTIGGIVAASIGLDLAKRHVPGVTIATVILTLAASTLYLTDTVSRARSYTFACGKPGCRVRITAANPGPADLDRLQGVAADHNRNCTAGTR
ncbi:hypothetical protein ACWCPS_35995 [Streptomyces mauvecolor]